MLILNNKPLKGYSTQKWKFCHHLLTLKLLQTCMSFFLLLNTKEDILENDWNFGTIDFHSVFFFFYGRQWCQTTVWFQSFFKISSFVFNRRKKLIQVICNKLRVSKWWQNFHYWVEYPFNSVLTVLNNSLIHRLWITYIVNYIFHQFGIVNFQSVLEDTYKGRLWLMHN